jgi:hypothetical protein
MIAHARGDASVKKGGQAINNQARIYRKLKTKDVTSSWRYGACATAYPITTLGFIVSIYIKGVFAKNEEKCWKCVA